jgi:hypothetical protein
MRERLLWSAVGVLSLAFATTATAAPLQPGWSAVGNAGVGSPNGVVTAPPAFGPNYNYVTTADGVDGGGTLASAGLSGETNGSTLTSPTFTAAAGDLLQFFFNYVTSDGSGFADYAWATLNDASTDAEAAILFTARTQPSGDIVPGFGLPSASATFTPASTEIISGGPAWSELGGSSGLCFDAGCGYTGWVQSNYMIQTAGTYKLLFGVTNWDDQAYDSGMAIAGATIDGKPIDPTDPNVIPLPATIWLLGAGLAGLAGLRRRRPA